MDLNYRINNTPLSLLTSTDSLALDSIANVDDVAGKYAQGILSHFYNKVFEVKLPFDDGALSVARVKNKVIDYNEILPEQQLLIYPNPTSADINLINYDTKLNNLSIEITDLTGRIIKRILLAEYAYSSKLQTNDLISGSYFVNVYSNNKLIFNEKFIVAKK